MVLLFDRVNECDRCRSRFGGLGGFGSGETDEKTNDEVVGQRTFKACQRVPAGPLLRPRNTACAGQKHTEATPGLGLFL